MARCNRCGRILKRVVYFNGNQYGPKCAQYAAKRFAANMAGIAAAAERHAADLANPPAGTPPPALKAYFMSRPNTTAADRRTWLVRSTVEGNESFLVRVYPDELGRTARCDCPFGKRGKRCPHVDLIADLDGRKFILSE